MHTLTWLIWLASALIAATLAPSPLYLALIFLAAAQVFLACRGDSPMARSFGLFVRAGAFVFVGYVIFSLITVGGARGETVLLDLPALRLPSFLGGVVLGGPVTAEALAWGATRGLSIWALMVIFGAFNALVDHHRLLRMAPPSLYHAGLAITIAVAFVPALLRAIIEVGQAQRARGHRFGGPRSWVALAAPLLAGSLEKSVQLAESLDARGYGRAGPDDAPARHQLVLIAGSLLLAGGLVLWLYYGVAQAAPAATMASAGGVCLGMAARAIGRRVRRSAYRRERWRRRDALASLAAVGCALAIILLRMSGDAGLVYYPFPQLIAPAFDLRAGMALLLLATPALVGAPAAPRAARRARRAART
ncbi:energy-coupling factor transporter transmembrane component T [Oscillochloris sp. ZM17-4]|uniref:energy-coupling factor transporter transmembrane component T n=1 Tax=Oscillochloris sp. ZM17-4 TaxID=2866714 RepID=UPI002106AAC2|nr:energy-coupling factor transporter transmembrane component T [Oscillochloris sp. ZM17-4]